MMIIVVLCVIKLIFARNYAVVVDAGSTSSKMNVYYWDDITNIQQVSLPSPLKKMQKLSAYVGNSTGLQHDFYNFVQPILSYIPKESISSTPFYLGATAGLRLLTIPDAQELIEGVRGIIEGKFEFLYSDRHIRVLSGEEEGIFGWITVQYLNQDFSFTNTFGALDMGGASTQISLIPTKQQILADKKTIKIFGVVVDVYSHSFLKYGLNEAYNLVLDVLVRKYPGKSVVENPCLFEGYNETDREIFIVGTSDIKGCADITHQLLHLNKFCFYPNETCSVDGEYVPVLRETDNFYAFSGFYFLLVGLKLEPEQMTLSKLQTAANQFCSHDYQWALNNSGFESEYVSRQCFNLMYGLQLLIDGYKFNPDSSSQIVFVQSVKGKDVGWALGSLLYEQMFVSTSLGRRSDDVELY